MKKILVIGGGGREHALAWKLASDTDAPHVFCAPGNAGTARCGTNVNIGSDDLTGLLSWAEENRPDLTVVGPEAPLCAGLADMFADEGLAVFGPTRNGARLEGSKIFAKEIMTAAGVPTAESESFTDPDRALKYIEAHTMPIVIKADGLASGKGVLICNSVGEAQSAIKACLTDNRFGSAGREILVEEYLVGEEASILALVDGNRAVPLASSQDHKRVFNNDEGPNTGGMGAYSPAPVVTEHLGRVIRQAIFEPMLAELKKRKIIYKGVLYAGIMVTASGPKVLEFNCRFGDPETQAILPRLDRDLGPALEACVTGKLSPDMIRWKPDHCVCVVMASGGYPDSYEKGKVITGLETATEIEDITVFHAGTRSAPDGKTVTAGGRVLGVTALGPNLESAVKRVYLAMAGICFDQAQYRTDIAAKALRRKP